MMNFVYYFQSFYKGRQINLLIEMIGYRYMTKGDIVYLFRTDDAQKRTVSFNRITKRNDWEEKKFQYNIN